MRSTTVRIVGLVLLLSVTATARAGELAAAPPTLAGADFLTPPGERWTLAWSDEFDGDALDSAKWSIGLPWIGDDGTNRHHNGQYASVITDDDVAVRGGALHLTTQRREVTGGTGRTYQFTEGLVTTSGKFSLAYGYYEMRALLPTEAGPGTWPAFWMLAGGWPPEMDILEYWGSASRIHQGTVTAKPDGGQLWESYHRSDVSLSGWHTYGLEWGPGYQRYSIDGEVTNAIYGGHLPRVAHYLLLNSAIESGLPPRLGTTFPNDFVVDYVRVYARPDVPALVNGGFESAEMRPWGPWNSAAVVDYGARSGQRALRVDGGVEPAAASSAQQTVFGLRPATRYRLIGYARTTGDARARLGVKEHGGPERRSGSRTSDAYRPLTLGFATGPDTTSATVYCWGEGEGTVFFDDVTLVEVGPA
jgi:beta-glucanase (GH16 family)